MSVYPFKGLNLGFYCKEIQNWNDFCINIKDTTPSQQKQWFTLNKEKYQNHSWKHTFSHYCPSPKHVQYILMVVVASFTEIKTGYQGF